MITALELASYHVGIRLMQTRIVHSRCISPSPDSLCFRTGPDQVVIVKHALDELDFALAQLIGLAGVPEPLRSAGHVLVEDCKSLWNKWSVTLTEQLDDDFDDSVFQDNLDRLKEHIERLFRIVGSRSGKAASWFSLGELICDTHLDIPGSRPRPAGLDIVLEQPRSKPAWAWSNEEEISELTDHVGVHKRELCPDDVDAEQVGMQIAYDPDEDEIWFRVEAGLNQLAAKVPNDASLRIRRQTSTGILPSQPGENASVVAPRDLDDGRGKPRLHVDVEKHLALLDGDPFPISRRVALFLNNDPLNCWLPCSAV